MLIIGMTLVESFACSNQHTVQRRCSILLFLAMMIFMDFISNLRILISIKISTERSPWNGDPSNRNCLKWDHRLLLKSKDPV